MKNQKKFAIGCLIGGAILYLIFAVTGWADTYRGGMLCGMATCFIAIGAFRLVRLRRLAGTPEKAADYEASMKDERTVYIANKARSLTFAVSVYAELAIGLIAMFVFDQRLLGQVMCYVVSGKCLLFTGLFYFYKKKY